MRIFEFTRQAELNSQGGAQPLNFVPHALGSQAPLLRVILGAAEVVQERPTTRSARAARSCRS